jgi:hypothetical protein
MSDKWDNQNLGKFSLYAEPNLVGAKILIAMGSLSISGGSNLIFQYASVLQKAGAQVFIGYQMGKSSDADWHPLASEFNIAPLDEYQRDYFDLGIATWWRTVGDVAQINCATYLYFVQALEPKFELDFGNRLSEAQAAATYLADFPMVTVGSWLQNLLIAQTGNPVWFVQNGIEKNQFFKSNDWSPTPIEKGKLRVLVEGSLGVGRKAVQEAIDLSIAADVGEVWHVSPEKGGASNMVSRKFEQVSYDKMPEIYRNVDLLVKVSRHEGMFGPPLEAFHCGATALVSRVTGYDEYIQDGRNAIAVEVDDFEIATEMLKELASNESLLRELKSGAEFTASRWPTIQETARKFANVCYTVLSSSVLPRPDASKIQDLSRRLTSLQKQGEDPCSILPLPLVTL